MRLDMGAYYAGKGDYEMWVVDNNEVKKRKVLLGENSFDYVEVVEGLQEGEQVIISNMGRYRDKERLKIQ